MAEKKFPNQTNYGWGTTFNMTARVPIVANRIFDTYAEMESYVNDPNDYAMDGLILAVVGGNDKGVYFVQQSKYYNVEGSSEVKSRDKSIILRLYDQNSEKTLDGGFYY